MIFNMCNFSEVSGFFPPEEEKENLDDESKQVIKGAILENDFLKHLDGAQLKALVDAMVPKEVPQGCYIIREGDAGSHLYVGAEGDLEVIKGGSVLGRVGPGKIFGELALLYNCQRTASIRAVTAAKLWSLERRVFQEVMMHTGLQRREDNLHFLRSVPLLQNLANEMLMRIADVLEVEFFPQGAYVVRQGGKGDTFYIISSGEVKVTQVVPSPDDPNMTVEEEIRILGRGDYFGEQALMREDVRTANVIALDGGVECLVVDRDSFTQLIGDLRELREKKYEDSDRSSRTTSVFSNAAEDCDVLMALKCLGKTALTEHNHISMDDLNVIGTLGVGGFGRVELVQYARDKTATFALKCLKKQHIVDTQQQIHVLSEKKIMMHCRHPFIARYIANIAGTFPLQKMIPNRLRKLLRLFRTYKDGKFVYLLLEALLGGELWTVLREHGRFDENTARFYAGCVLEAFEYLHGKGIIYRDLKPENLLMDSSGFVDFGFSKRLGPSEKTWTFCGTPEYVAPEVILNKGHDKAVDYWSLGVFLFELLTGAPPFSGSDPMRTYSVILRGIDCIPFPRHISRNAQGVIRRLCRDNPSERLGYGRNSIADIKKHKWFQGFDWDGLRNRQLPPPIVPQVKGPADISNFDSYPKDLDIPNDELSGWDKDF
ncbi:unnamed protein product [Notodromas monacha]|uniref:cGMP-dependent protein kinase n=1 Tax=Notodromas monacha TaxID=399045 RepID=A0A7R9BU18_9CRUS|nr:unnamed protein product [Notodromas monacha]CAG0920690.1 unnamed protein product [Notodromas monacha]